MKRLFTLLFLLSAFDSYFAQISTCTLDPVFVASNKKGIWPDSVTNFISGTVGVPYFQNLTIKVPKDTVVNPLTMCFNRIEVSSPTVVVNYNLPPGLSMLAGNNVTLTSGTFKFPGNANTCADISGTPTTAGTYSLQFKVQPYMTPAVTSCPGSPNVSGGSASYAQATYLKYYKIVINLPAGVKENVNKTAFSLNAFPNPANGKTTVKFIVEDESAVSITVKNILGQIVMENKGRTKIGLNQIEVNCQNWESGLYFYTIQYKNYSETKRLIVSSSGE
ncbi:MAG TPA: T9SS type A sorting domain-containing protein [Bacteroidia bacterium]|jgi:hypothetical protein|nr:T9SS type A sorting domain-containing protein [Bacteroidia bacterium]